MFKKFVSDGYVEYRCDFGRRGKSFVSYCTVRASKKKYEEAEEIFREGGKDAGLTIYGAQLIIYDKSALKYLDAYLYQPETDSFIKFTPDMWGLPLLADYGAFTGGRFYAYDATVQVHVAGLMTRQNPTGGLEDEEGKLILTTCYIFVEYL